eukprot:1152346-Pelagomonas_calceolata.AAC.1
MKPPHLWASGQAMTPKLVGNRLINDPPQLVDGFKVCHGRGVQVNADDVTALGVADSACTGGI